LYNNDMIELYKKGPSIYIMKVLTSGCYGWCSTQQLIYITIPLKKIFILVH